jgi:NADH dehydrogenase FAD-containing subunit
MTSSNARTRLVFVGGGHAHIYSLHQTRRLIEAGAEVTLIGPDRFHYYSGMGPGMLSRIYEPDDLRFDVRGICTDRGGTFVQAKVVAVDANDRQLTLDSGETLPYDLASFNVGSHVPLHLIPGAEAEAFPVKPIESIERIRETILAKLRDGTPTILIIGGGPAGVEVSSNVWRLVREHRGNARIIVANGTGRLLPSVAEKAGRLAERSLTERGVEIRPNHLAESMRDGVAKFKGHEDIAYDVAIMTIGIVPSSLFVDSGLETGQDGGLLVNEYLQSVRYPEIFGGGDCITMRDHPLARVGVYAVRQAPVLFENLMAALKGRPLKSFVPQKVFLLIFNMGDGSGILVRGSFVWHGKLAFTLKNYIDTRFIARFQE